MEPGTIVWVSLGHSYGRWPAIVSELQQRPVIRKDILDELGDQFNEDKEKVSAEDQLFVKFFDDEDFELVLVNGLNKIESYSCKSKKKYIRAGFLKHEENKKGNLGGANLRLAQFYKDVEMAEVMTDNEHAVAKILESYEIAEIGESENESSNMVLQGQVTEREGTGYQSDARSGHACELAEQSDVAHLVKSKTSKKRAKKGFGSKKVQNGRVAKKT